MDVLWNNLISNPERLLIISLLIGILLVLWRYKKSFLFAWFSVFILSFAFNISLQLDFLAPFYDPYVLNIKMNYLIPTIYWLDIMFIALFSYYVVLLLPRLWSKNRFIIWLVVAVLGFWITHIIFHPEIVAIINITRLVVYIGTGMLVSFASQIQFKTLSLCEIVKQYKVWYLWLLLFTALLQLVIGGLQYVSGTDIGLSMLGESDLVAGMVGSSFIVSDNSVFLRAYGTFPHPNLYGAFFVGLLYLALWVLDVRNLDLSKNPFNKMFNKLEFKKKIALVLSAILAIISVFGIILSFSRIAYLGVVLLVIGVVMDLVLGRNFKYGIRNKKYANGGFLMTGLDRTLKFGASLSERTYLLVVAGKMLLANIWLGVGAGMFVREIPNVINRSSMLTGYSGILLLQPVHNTFALFLVEYGLLGLFFIGIIIWLLRTLFMEVGGGMKNVVFDFFEF